MSKMSKFKKMSPTEKALKIEKMGKIKQIRKMSKLKKISKAGIITNTKKQLLRIWYGMDKETIKRSFPRRLHLYIAA